MPDDRSERKRPGRPFLGWRYETLVPPPGPPPRRPTPDERVDPDEQWEQAKLRSEAETNRPLLFGLCLLVLIGTVLLLLTMLGVMPLLLAVLGCLACLVVAFPVLLILVQSRSDMGEMLARERTRRVSEQERRERELRERQEEHAARYTEWQHRKRVYEAQPRWHAVEIPEDVHRVTVVGGTEAGWSALLTTLGAALIKDGGDLTVVDLSGRAAAGQFVALTQRCGLIPRVWVLPADLPRVKIGANLNTRRRAAILAATAQAVESGGDADADRAVLERIFTVLGGDTEIVRVVAALGLVGLPGEDDARGDPALLLLTRGEREKLREVFADDPAAVARAAALRRALLPFEGLGSRAEREPYAQVKIIATDRSAGEFAERAYGTYTVEALSTLLDLRAARNGPGRPWARMIVLCGADALPEWAVRRLTEAAARLATGVVLLYRRAGENALAQLRCEGTLPVIMRQPDADSAEAAAGFLGAVRPGRMHPLTEIVGAALDGTTADSYATDTSEQVTAAAPVRYAAKSIAPLTLVRHIRAATAWGKATSQAAEQDTLSADDHTDRLSTQKFDVYGLQRLPHTAVVVPGAGEAPMVADANPGILALPTATLQTAAEAEPPAAEAESPAAEVEANIGPPPERLDWRRPVG
ncbi:hypothetical protein FOF52_14015 [Thermobifida alba]|uniref:TraD/TraG TraM recognition site domain-containing protein n=1 Tax=Thermobifida alba TaxID=53522 RepID=A0ABY4L2P5_THEAE|nr:hypothetical protein [Thermobifida alba]UPT21934.1 hypothetical protein FOF52_14015 [Thermobifida alba]